MTATWTPFKAPPPQHTIHKQENSADELIYQYWLQALKEYQTEQNYKEMENLQSGGELN